MRRKLFTLAAGVSAVLCVGVCVLWVRSYQVCDKFTAQCQEVTEDDRDWRAYYQCLVATHRGQFYGWFLWSEPPEERAQPPWQFTLEHPDGADADVWIRPGFRASRHRAANVHEYDTWTLIVPGWTFFCAFAVLPSIAGFRQLRAARRRQRAPPGYCPACGYDLRATPGRCPECGAVPAAKGERA